MEQGDVDLENGSRVFTSATTTSGIRGKSVNWLYIDEETIIPNNIAEEFFVRYIQLFLLVRLLRFF